MVQIGDNLEIAVMVNGILDRPTLEELMRRHANGIFSVHPDPAYALALSLQEEPFLEVQIFEHLPPRADDYPPDAII